MALQNTIQQDVQEFLAKLPNWQRFLLSQLVTGRSNDSEAVAKAYRIFLYEVGLSSEQEEVPPADFTSLLAVTSVSGIFKKLRLLSVKDFENVNAIRAKQLITFGPNITVIYGDNGSGKSGFARIFSNVFYSRGDRSILSNVFAPKTNLPAKATFIFQDGDGQPYEIDFASSSQKAEFRQFAVFDSKSVQVHVGGGNEIYVPPKELAYFERLAALTVEVGVTLDAEILKRRKTNEISALFEGASPIRSAIEGLNGKTDLEKVKAESQLSSDEKARTVVLEQELAKLMLQDIEKRKKELSLLKISVLALKEQVTRVEDHFASYPTQFYQEAIESHQKLTASADAIGLKQFSDAQFSGIGSQAWKRFLESAHAFADVQTQPYPKHGSQCLLCRQTLTSNAAALVEKYWAFLKGEDETKVKLSQNKLMQLREKLVSLNYQGPSDDSTVTAWIGSFDSAFVPKLNAFLQRRQVEANHLAACIEKLTWTPIETTVPIEWLAFSTFVAKVEDELTKLNAETAKTIADKLHLELRTLKHREKLGEHYENIESFVLNCRWLDLATEQRKKISTKATTDIHKKIHDELLNKKYIQLFHQECTVLKAPFKVDLEQRGSGGKTKRHLYVEGIQSGQVLSEGEQRAIALADFFTEIEMSGIGAGVIFDDPVNSLDHVRRDIIARRLAEAGKVRQVIVFTHDLSFLYDLRNAASEANVDLQGHWVERYDDMSNFETGIVHLNCAPISEGDFVDSTEAEQCLKDAKSATNPKDKVRRVKDGMSNLRTSYEAFILSELFGGTVSRFDKHLNHSKFDKTFAPREYIELVGKKLKHLSGFIDAHLHSNSSIGANPTSDHLAQEIREYQEMKGKFRSERKVALNL